MSSDLDKLKAALAGRAEDLARALIPEGARQGSYWINERQNFWVNLPGGTTRNPGSWRDPVAGEHGGPLDLIMRVNGLEFKAALGWARDFLGWGQLTDSERDRIAVEQARRRAEAEAKAAEDIVKHRNSAFASWLRCEKSLRGTLAETYLAGRGIDLAALHHVPGALRFAPARKHYATGCDLPAIVALVTGPDPAQVKESVPYGIHVTYLAPDGRSKADVEPQRIIWPAGISGGSIRLSPGETGKRPREAAALGLLDTLCLCEGIEDGLSLVLAAPELRVWAGLNLSNLRHIAVPTCSDQVIVAADNDWGKPQAAKSLDVALAALARQGREVRVARSHIGKDANDALRASF